MHTFLLFCIINFEKSENDVGNSVMLIGLQFSKGLCVFLFRQSSEWVRCLSKSRGKGVHSPNFTRLRYLKSVPFKWVYCNTMRHIPQEDDYLIIYKRLQSFICRMLLIQPGLYVFILRSRLLIETFLGRDASQIQKQTHHIKRNSNL